MRTRLVCAAVFLIACGGDPDTTIEVGDVTPDHGTLVGGTRIVITGQGFVRAGAAPNRVLIGNREAPLAAAIDDNTLEVVTPPGDTSGDVPITVFNQNGQGKAMGLFRYSAAPTVTATSPADVVFNATSATVTLTGSGFKDDDAGFVRVFVNDVPAVDVQVTSDTQLSFTAPVGNVFDRPVIKVVNARGEGEKTRAFRYVPSTNPVLMMFSRGSQNTFAVFYDPMTDVVATVPNKLFPQSTLGFRAVVQDAAGDFWGVDRTNRLGKIDLEKQVLVNPMTLPGALRISSLARIGNTVFALNEQNQSFGTLNLTTGSFSVIRTPGFSRNGQSLAANGTTLHYIQENTGVSTLDVGTGVRGAIAALSPTVHATESRFLGTTMFTVNRLNPTGLVSVNPTTGATTISKTFAGVTLTAMEVFPPGAPSTVP